ncbi:MAG: GAF domain-containing SpoIIE family protein phosphatase, partial [Chloroflexota bacterium]
LMTQAWQKLGAERLVVIVEEAVVYSSDDDLSYPTDMPMLKAPWRIDETLFLLCAVGINEVAHQTRLFADASLLSRICQRESDIGELSDTVMQYQDQLLILYELNEKLQFQTKLQHILHILAEQTQLLLDVFHVFVIIDPLAEKPQLAQIGDGYVPIDVIASWYGNLDSTDEYVLMPSPIKHTSQVMVMPVTTDDRALGIMGVIRDEGTFSMPEIKMARAIVEQGSAHVQKAFLIQERLQQERISVEMSVARDLQMSLLPDPPASIEGLDVWSYCRPALEVGGDFYEFMQRGKSFRFALGDVAGKGISAALLMAMSRTVLKVLKEPTPMDVMERFNEHLYDDFSRVHSFVTLFLGYYDLVTHSVTYANAGHSPVIYCPVDDVPRILEADSPPIGVLDETMVANHTIRMEKGDVLVVSSDGIPEATHLMGTMLGYQNMLDMIEAYRHSSAKKIGKMLLKAANLHHIQDDDQTIVVIKRVN